MFTLDSEIEIGSFKFKGVYDLVIKKSIFSTVETAVIKLPANAKVKRDGKTTPVLVKTNTQFNVGDEVTIKLGYNNSLKQEFKGFVKSMDMNNPLEVQCEGYSYLLGKTNIKLSETNISVKDLLGLAVKNISPAIEVQCDLDVTLVNVQVDGTANDVIAAISRFSDGCIKCFFVAYNKLWCGFINSRYSEGEQVFPKTTVNFRPGFNLVVNNTLNFRGIKDVPTKVVYGKRMDRGVYIFGESDKKYGISGRHKRTLNQVTTKSALLALANEKAADVNYDGFSGAIRTFLEPYTQPTFAAALYESGNGNYLGSYLVEKVTTHFGVGGAWREVELGIKIQS